MKTERRSFLKSLLALPFIGGLLRPRAAAVPEAFQYATNIKPATEVSRAFIWTGAAGDHDFKNEANWTPIAIKNRTTSLNKVVCGDVVRCIHPNGNMTYFGT